MLCPHSLDEKGATKRNITEYVETTSKAVQIILSLRAVLDMEKEVKLPANCQNLTLSSPAVLASNQCEGSKEIKNCDAVAEIRAGWVASI